MVLRLSVTATTAMRMMNEEKLRLLFIAILRTMNNSSFKREIYIFAKIIFEPIVWATISWSAI